MCFNPRVRAGRDYLANMMWDTLSVSIHASARDATRTQAGIAALIIVSIHASARDATLWVAKRQLNPRVRAGRDLNAVMPRTDRTVSIHASARDAT